MAKKTNCTINGKEYYRITRKIGMKRNKHGIWVDDRKTFYGSCKKEAEEKYQEYMEQQKTGTAISDCFGEVIEDWIEHVFKYSDLARSTKAKYISAYEKLLQPSKLSGAILTDVSAMDLQKFYNNSDGAIATIKALHNLLCHFFKYAELQGMCRNITHSVTPPRTPKMKAESDVLTIDVWKDEDLKKVVREMKNHRLRLLVILAANTGCRIGELLALTYDDIRDGMLYISKQLVELTDDAGAYSLYIEKTKTPTSNRVIPLTDKVVLEIERHKSWQRIDMMENGYRTNYIFTSSNGTWYYRRNIARALNRFYRRAGVPHHKFHAFRHTFGTNLSRAGVSLEETAKLMGHSDISVTAKYYIEINAERKREAVEKILAYSFD